MTKPRLQMSTLLWLSALVAALVGWSTDRYKLMLDRVNLIAENEELLWQGGVYHMYAMSMRREIEQLDKDVNRLRRQLATLDPDSAKREAEIVAARSQDPIVQRRRKSLAEWDSKYAKEQQVK